MLNKNLRTVLYYVVTVSCLCLMIEFTKRIPDPRTSLSPQFYQVVTAKQSELLTLPQNDEDDKVRFHLKADVLVSFISSIYKEIFCLSIMVEFSAFKTSDFQ